MHEAADAGPDIGPDLVLAGAARSGTSSLAALLGGHPGIDPGAVKEPNYFSLVHDRGAGWYDGLFAPRRAGLVRLDASMTYTYPQHPDALATLAAEAPRARLVYAVRHPVERMLSHLALRREFFHNEAAQGLGEALDASPVYAGASDYARWIPELVERFGEERVLVVPFSVTTGDRRAAVDQICRLVGLPPAPLDEAAADLHRNLVVSYRFPGVARARRLVRDSGLYPTVRRTVGPDRLRRVRNWATREAPREPAAVALAGCSSEQLERLESLLAAAQAAVATHLTRQDQRLGLDWATAWERECPRGERLGAGPHAGSRSPD